jgi:hypothetical protein
MKLTYIVEVDVPEKREGYPDTVEQYIENAIECYHTEIGQDIFNFVDPKVLSVTQLQETQ